MNTQSTEVLRLWLTLRQIPKVGVKTLQKLMAAHAIELSPLLNLPAADLAQLKLNPQQIKAITQPDKQLIEQCLAWAEAPDHHILGYFDDNPDSLYPEYLKNIASPPLLLFIKGDPSLLNKPQLAMVGSRNLTITGQDNAVFFARQMAERGIVITSGLAIGVDGYSHRGALDGQGKTIAVLGTGLNQIYPKRHQHLAAEIAEKGALVSEFWPNQTVRAENFPRRNRIVSGLSQGTLVVEAALKSGSLITARYAMEQGREVFAIPGSIHNPMSKGCHALIKQGAKLTEDINDIIEDVPLFQQVVAARLKPSPIQADLPLTMPNQAIPNQAMPNQAIPNQAIPNQAIPNQAMPSQTIESPILQYIGFDNTPVDFIVQRSAMPVNEILCLLLDLEMAGEVAAVDGGYIRLLRR